MKNPLLSQVHGYNRRRVREAFPEIFPENSDVPLFFGKYVDFRPERFFSRAAYTAFLDEIISISQRFPTELAEYIDENAVEIDNAFRNAHEINMLEWHDDFIKAGDEYLTLGLIDRSVHPAYLRLVEAVFQKMLRIVAYFSRLARSKGVDGLNLYNVIEELPGSRFAPVKASYVHLMRNGIAHGGVTYSANQIIYKDINGKELIMAPRDVVQKFDDMLDVCNGLLLAYSVFALTRPKGQNAVPQSLMVEDLRAETGTPYWAVTGALPSTIIDGQRQLIVYCNVRTSDESKVRFSTIQTAVQAERVAPGYDRYFISMKAESGLLGWAAFFGKELRKHRVERLNLEQYADTIQDYLPIFLANSRVPKFIHRVLTFKYAIQLATPVILADFRASMKRPAIIVRSAGIHRQSWAAVLHADVVIEMSGQEVDQETARLNCRRAIRYAAKFARRQLSWLDIARYLPLGFVQIDMFATDYRARRLSGFGLGKDLIGTVRLQRLRQIKSPDIYGSTIEIWKGYRIAWNQSWLQHQAGA
jgi:hypothetical protein